MAVKRTRGTLLVRTVDKEQPASDEHLSLPHPVDGGIPTHQRRSYPCFRRDLVFQDQAGEASEPPGIRHGVTGTAPSGSRPHTSCPAAATNEVRPFFDRPPREIRAGAPEAPTLA